MAGGYTVAEFFLDLCQPRYTGRCTKKQKQKRWRGVVRCGVGRTRARERASLYCCTVRRERAWTRQRTIAV